MPRVAKVTAFITRLGRDGPECCVFEHPRAGVQLPAGTLHDGEDATVGALREAFEETGLVGLGYVREIATIPVVGDDMGALRSLVHLVAPAPAPDEWWVTTPDGGGLCWRCHWLPIDAAGDVLHVSQRPWLDAASAALHDADHPARADGPPLDRGALTIEMFWAPPWSGHHARMRWLEMGDGPDDAAVGRAEAVAFTTSDDIVAVCEDERRFWALPGGHRGAGEDLVATLRRELREEACAELRDHMLLGYQRFEHLDGPRAGTVSYDAMFWARVGLLPFVPAHETCERRVMPFSQARDLPLWANPITARLFERAAAVNASR